MRKVEVTSVKLTKTHNFGEAKAIASIVINNAICINNIRVIEAKNKTFIAMPSKKTPTGEFRDIAYPINQETRDIIEKSILKEYEKGEI